MAWVGWRRAGFEFEKCNWYPSADRGDPISLRFLSAFTPALLYSDPTIRQGVQLRPWGQNGGGVRNSASELDAEFSDLCCHRPRVAGSIPALGWLSFKSRAAFDPISLTIPFSNHKLVAFRSARGGEQTLYC